VNLFFFDDHATRRLYNEFFFGSKQRKMMIRWRNIQKSTTKRYQSRNYTNPIQEMLTKYITNIYNQITSSTSQQQQPENGYDDKQKPYVFKMIPLHDRNLLSNDPARSECTVYVKGFLSSHTNSSLVFPSYAKKKVNSNGEEEEDFTFDRSHFQFWKQSHGVLVQRESHKWAENAYGWDWPNGRFPHQYNFSSRSQQEEHELLKKNGQIDPRDELKFNPMSYIPLPVATLAVTAFQVASLLYRRSLIRFINPTVLLTSVLHDIAFTTVIGYLEFRQANINSLQYAHLLRDELLKLNQQYEKVRVVAHSLGAKHAVEAIKLLPVDERPSEVHLCAAAIPEKDIDEVLHEGLTNRHDPKHMTYNYWNDQDFLLNGIYRTITMGEIAIGCSELRGRYNHVKSIQVPIEHFPKVYSQSVVHNMYGSVFYKFASSPYLHHSGIQ
jgi:hypothetical protein